MAMETRHTPDLIHPRRRPRWVYDVGDEPDYRFSFANERTFLAWIRTAMALLGGGVALGAVDLSIPAAIQRGLAVLLVVVAMSCALVSWFRWALMERAMRQARPLPASPLSAVLSVVVLIAALVILVVVF